MTAKKPCEPCALHAAGREAEALAIESVRAQRILLALVNSAAKVNNADAASGEITAEVDGCRECTWRLSSILATMMAAQLIAVMGGTEGAAKFLEDSILEDLDDQGNA